MIKRFFPRCCLCAAATAALLVQMIHPAPLLQNEIICSLQWAVFLLFFFDHQSGKTARHVPKTQLTTSAGAAAA